MLRNVLSTVRWGRVSIAAVLSEVAVIAGLGAILLVYRYWIAPGRSPTEYEVFNDKASYYFAPTAAGVATFLAALWAVRKLDSGFVANGTMVGAIAVLLTTGFLFAAKPEERFMYGVSFVLRIVGGCAGGLAIQALPVWLNLVKVSS